MSDSNSSTSASSGGSVASTATLALVSTYIAEQRPEADRLGYWAEIAQAFSIGCLILAAAVLVFLGVFLVIAAFGRG